MLDRLLKPHCEKSCPPLSGLSRRIKEGPARFRYILFALIILSSFFFAGTDSRAAGPIDGNGQGMILVPEGDFFMGSNESGGLPVAETPRHRVYIKAFSMQVSEVTNAAFAAFLNSSAVQEKERESWIVIRNDLKKEGKKDWWPADIVYENGSYKAVPGFEAYPVLSVSWFAAEAYCRWAGGRLPTEAEWEKAARGGLPDSIYPWGNVLSSDGVVFNTRWKDNQYPPPTEPVRSFHPNGYGLFDMAGNVAEWCSDWYDPSYYRQAPPDNPKGPAAGETKVIRGGSWASKAPAIRVAARNFGSPGRLQSGVGFRCVKDLP